MSQTTASFLVLFAVVSLISAAMTKTAECIGFTQSTLHFLYSVMITIYAMENWTLLSDLNKNKDHVMREEAYTCIIKDFTTANNTLTARNGILESMVLKLRQDIKKMATKKCSCWRHNMPNNPLQSIDLVTPTPNNITKRLSPCMNSIHSRSVVPKLVERKRAQ